MATAPLPVHLVDLSHYQNVTQTYINDLKKAGVQGVYYKVTEGNRMLWRSHYNKVRAFCKIAKMPFGAYHFAGPSPTKADAVAEAEWFIKNAKPVPGDLIPMLDLESRASSMGPINTTSWAREFVKKVKQLGFETIIYTPFDMNDTFGCKLWVARYSNANSAPRIPKPWKNYSVRQFSNGVYGVPNSIANKRIDLNTFKGNDGTTLKDLVIPKPRDPNVRWEGTIATCNMQQFPKLITNVKKEFLKVLNQADIVGWQEVGNKIYKKELGSIDGHQHLFQGPIKDGRFVETPQSVRNDIKVLKSGEISWKQPNPDTGGRLVNRFASRNVLDLDGPVDVYSIHYQARAWNHKGTATPPRSNPAEAKQQPMRQKGWQAAQDALLADLEKSGIGPAVILTDQNRLLVPILGDKFKGRKVHKIPNGLDWIYLIDGKNSKWELIGKKKRIKNPGDHDAVLQKVRLVRK